MSVACSKSGNMINDTVLEKSESIALLLHLEVSQKRGETE